ncbi:MAG: O-methyltransferase [Bacteroidia bacterium]
MDFWHKVEALRYYHFPQGDARLLTALRRIPLPSFHEIYLTQQKSQSYLQARTPSPYGAGSQRQIFLGTSPFLGRWLYRIAHHYAPKRILELGTHIGIGTLYLAYGAPEAEIHTLEAHAPLAQKAQENFQAHKKIIILHQGTFEALLPSLEGSWDLVFIDGNHRRDALENYLHLLQPKTHIFVLDDIRYNAGMRQAWLHLRRIGCFLDIGFLGVWWQKGC